MVLLHCVDVIFLVRPDLLILRRAGVGMVSQDRRARGLHCRQLCNHGFERTKSYMDHVRIFASSFLPLAQPFYQGLGRAIVGGRRGIDHH
jgi:hypothetical protein